MSKRKKRRQPEIQIDLRPPDLASALHQDAQRFMRRHNLAAVIVVGQHDANTFDVSAMGSHPTERAAAALEAVRIYITHALQGKLETYPLPPLPPVDLDFRRN